MKGRYKGMKKLLVTVLAVGLMATITACDEEKKETNQLFVPYILEFFGHSVETVGTDSREIFAKLFCCIIEHRRNMIATWKGRDTK